MTFLRLNHMLTGLMATSLLATPIACDSDPKDSAGSDSESTGSQTTAHTDSGTTDATDATSGDGTTGDSEATSGDSASETGNETETGDTDTTETGDTTDTTETGDTESTESGDTSDSSESETGDPPDPGEVMICGPDAPDDQVFIHGVELTGDTMYVHLSYSGGCAEHELSHCWDGAFAESEPVQAFTRIAHNANMDACEAELDEMLSIDLTPMKTAWQEGYQQDSGTIIVHLDGWQETLTYTF